MGKYLPRRMIAFIMSIFIFITSFFYEVQNEENPYEVDVIIAQSEDENKYHFPDVVTLPDGKILVAFYKNTVHAASSAQEPFGTLCIVESTDNGLSWSEPREIVSPGTLIELGICEPQQPVEARDPNLTLLNDGTVLMTFFTRMYTSDNNVKTYIMESNDNGLTWSMPVVIPSEILDQYCAKRGNIAVFDDDEILVPLYGSASSFGSASTSVVVRGTKIDGQWQWSNEVVQAISSEDDTYNEISLVATGEDTVYALARQPGSLFKSTDSGLTWEVIDCEGDLHQPGFAIVDCDRVFVTWSIPGSPRPIYGKMFYHNEGWAITSSKRIYALPKLIAGSVDMGDPSCTLTSDGKILVVYYQTMDKIIGGTFVDLDDWEIGT